MPELSFDIKDTKDFLKKLLEDYSEYKQHPTSSRIAINCAMTAWHLTDWSYSEYIAELVDYPNLTSYCNALKELCPPLQFMHDIANGSKHYLLTRHQAKVTGTELHRGPFSRVFSRAFDISILKVKVDDKTIYFDDILKTVIDFWIQYLNQKFRIILE